MTRPDRKLPSEDPSNNRRGVKFVAGELWNHLPVWFFVYTILMLTMMTLVFFYPSRRLWTFASAFPLFTIFIYFYARFSSDPGRTSALKPIVIILGSLFVILIAFNLFFSPVWKTEVIVPIKQFYPDARLDQTGRIRDELGHPLPDAAGRPLEKGEIMTAPDGRQYRVEGKLLVDLEKKARIIAGHEISNVFWLMMMVLHCRYFRGREGLIRFFGAALIYGFLLESGGVSGDFFRENDYHVYLPVLAAPAATMAGWAMIFYSSVFTYEMIERRWPKLKTAPVWVAGLIISLIALSWDLNIDPVATGLGFWTWHELLPDWFLGVPLLNFTSWFSAVFVFGAGYTYIHRRISWNDREKNVAMFVMIPVCLIAAALINFALFGIFEGFHGPTWQVLSRLTAG